MQVYAAQRDVDVIARAAGCDGELGSEGIIGGEGGGCMRLGLSGGGNGNADHDDDQKAINEAAPFCPH